MLPNLKFWGAPKRRTQSRNRHNTGLRFEPLESRQLLTVAVPDPIAMAGFVGNDLVINGTAPEIHVRITEVGATLTVEGLTRDYLGTDGDIHTIQTDINNSDTTSVDFDASRLRDLKIKLGGDDSILEVGDPTAGTPVVGRDLIVSMAASTSSAGLTKAGVKAISHLCIDLNTATIGRNLTITTGQPTTGEAAVIDVTNDVVLGATTIKTYGDFPNLIGVGNLAAYGDVSLTTAAGNDLIAMVGASVAGRLTVSAGSGDNTVLVDNNFTEVIDSNLQTFVTSNPVFGDGLGDDELTDPCVQTLSNDLSAASGWSFYAKNVNIYTLGAGNDIIDVHDAQIGGFSGSDGSSSGSGGNLVISASGAGTHVIAVTDTQVAGNCTITGGSGDDVAVIDGLSISSALTVNTGGGNDVIVASPDVGGVADAAITDFVANHPGVFFDAGDPGSTGLDTDNLLAEILDLDALSSFDAAKASFVTNDAADDGSSIDISLASVELSITITMGNGTDFLASSQTEVGTTATVHTGNGDDTVIVTGLGGLATDGTSGGSSTPYTQSGAVPVPASTTGGPVISNVIYDPSKNWLTWNEADPDGVAGARLLVDGLVVPNVYGPYPAASGVNFTAALGSLAAGAHSYVIIATDKLGNASTQSGAFIAPAPTPPSPIVAAQAFKQFTLTTGNGNDTVVVSLDYVGEPGYALGDYGIAAAIDNFANNNPLIYNSIEAVGTELEFAAEAILENAANSSSSSGETTPYSVDADNVTITVGNGTDRVTASDMLVSTLNIRLGAGRGLLEFYDNLWSGSAYLNGGLHSTSTLDVHRGGNSDSNIIVVNFGTVVPDSNI